MKIIKVGDLKYSENLIRINMYLNVREEGELKRVGGKKEPNKVF